ncbi:ABC transporter permease [Aminivibrio sp.]|jgi:simple sugar transport system permease protein|uniref:ABC transporter permease subunit n=1 Tax=Aminivibrio sp. TaxID=1872489 RepID=UPI001A43DB4D|nr:ABC transporter permease [Aminivibrio sp.]MBL3538981.1 ABC transporter permease [Aminivibrio sp.]MDK2958894.1 simple sugar transport system permease protein [Synergistaceae bacterium]
MDGLNRNSNGAGSWILENLVTIIFVAFTLFGFMVSSGVSVGYFFSELSSRVFRNSFLVLSLIIPVLAGLGLNFGIVIGAMSGQVAIAIARYFEMGGISGLLFCFATAMVVAALCGYFTGRLYNKTRGQEMIASLIVGFFANGIYQFLFLFVVGVIIAVPATHPMIKPDGVGIRMTVDLVPVKQGGLKYALDNIYQVPFVHAILAVAIGLFLLIVVRYWLNIRKGRSYLNSRSSLIVNGGLCLALAGVAIHAMVTKSELMMVRKVPVVTGLLIIGLCVFTVLIMKTKLGQDFRSVGQSQHTAEVSGINVDRTRIIATMISTVLASWGQIIYLQNMGTLNTYNAHTQIGMFSVAALLVGGASTSKAGITHAIFGTILFNAMFIMSPEIGQSLFGQALLGEYFRTFMVYGVIGVALGIHVWKANKKSRIVVE